MPDTVTIPEGITPLMIRLGVLGHDIQTIAAEAYRLEIEVGELLAEMAPAHLTGEPSGNDEARDAFWERFSTLVSEAERARGEEA
jgi:hypothetical protein